MCGTKCHTGQSATSHTCGRHLLNPVGATSRVLCLMDLMPPVIMYMSYYPAHVICMYLSCHLITCYMHYYCYWFTV